MNYFFLLMPALYKLHQSLTFKNSGSFPYFTFSGIRFRYKLDLLSSENRGHMRNLKYSSLIISVFELSLLPRTWLPPLHISVHSVARNSYAS